MGDGQKNSTGLWPLFRTMLIISAFTFGGGFVMISLMKKKFVEELRWLEEDEMLDIAAIAQSSPGPIFINAAVIVGYRMRGIVGALTAAFGTALPPMVIISVISVFYAQFRSNSYVSIALQVMRAGVAAVIIDVVINLAQNVFQAKRPLYLILLAGSFLAAVFFGINAVFVIVACLAIGLADLFNSMSKRKGAE